MNFLIQNGVVQEKKKEFKHNLNENKRWKSHFDLLQGHGPLINSIEFSRSITWPIWIKTLLGQSLESTDS
jgi:hypothetical protein